MIGERLPWTRWLAIGETAHVCAQAVCRSCNQAVCRKRSGERPLAPPILECEDYAFGLAKPDATAHTAIWTRELQPNLERMFATCRSTVPSAMVSAWAIWRFDL